MRLRQTDRKGERERMRKWMSKKVQDSWWFSFSPSLKTWKPREQMVWFRTKAWHAETQEERIQFGPKSRKKMIPQLNGNQVVGILIHSRVGSGVSIFVLFRHLIDWMGPSRIREGNLLFSVYWFNLIPKHTEWHLTKYLDTHNPVKVNTKKITITMCQLILSW